MGYLGKDNNPRRKIPAIGRAATLMLMLAPLIAVAGCTAGRNGRYAGSVVTQAGVCGLTSNGGHADGTLMIRGDEVVFSPDQGVVLLNGRVDTAGHVKASVTAPGIDHKPFPMVFEGDLQGTRIAGRYATPRCRATVQLDRVGAG
jgi:hypothetical protein